MKRIPLYAVLAMALLCGDVHSASIEWSPQFSTQGTYTDNLFLSEDDEIDEFITTVSVGLTASIFEKTRGLEFTYKPEYSIYGKYDENNTLRHDAALIAWNDLDKHTRLEFIDRFLLTEDPLGEDDLTRDERVVVPGDYTNRTSREKYYRNTSILNFTRRFGKNDLFRAGFVYGFLENDDPTVDDNRRYEPSAGLNYMFADFYGMEASGVYTRGEFDSDDRDSEFSDDFSDDFDNWRGSIRLKGLLSKHSTLFVQYDHIYRDYDEDGAISSNRDYQVYHPMAGYAYEHKDDLVASVALGYYYQDEDEGESHDGLSVTTDIRKHWRFKRGVAAFLANSGIDQEEFGAQRLGLRQFVSLRVSALYRMYKDLSGNVYCEGRYSNTIGDSEGDSDDSVEEQIRYSAGAGLAYEAYRWMIFDLNYRFSRFDSDSDDDFAGDDDEYSENRIVFTITLRPDSPLRL